MIVKLRGWSRNNGTRRVFDAPLGGPGAFQIGGGGARYGRAYAAATPGGAVIGFSARLVGESDHWVTQDISPEEAARLMALAFRGHGFAAAVAALGAEFEAEERARQAAHAAMGLPPRPRPAGSPG